MHQKQSHVVSIQPGYKVIVRKREANGFAEVSSSVDARGLVQISYFISPVTSIPCFVSVEDLATERLPPQTRCFIAANEVRYGRVLACETEGPPPRYYFVKFPDEDTLVRLREDEFSVRSYCPGDDPLDVLAALANETPFFFENRATILRELLHQHRLAHGLPTLLSSKVDLFPHQLQIADRILRDPTIRFLLADEVGLGKTIEAGLVLRQLKLDAPETKIGVFVPDQLTQQWSDELIRRFELYDAEVLPHSALAEKAKIRVPRDVVVIDEAHRLFAGQGCQTFAQGATYLAAKVRHLLLLSATPALYHDAELLALLELLDPDHYSTSDLEAFQARTARRAEMGRAFLALQSAQIGPLIKLNAKRLAELLPQDAIVQQLAESLAAPEVDFAALKQTLHIHISETYRIHRRMLRTRRRWLAETNQQFVRAVEERTETELDEKPHEELWRALEEWRTEIAARVASSPAAISVYADEYIRIAETIAAEPDQLGEVVEEVALRTNATSREKQLLEDLVDPRSAKTMTRARAELIWEIIRRRMERETRDTKIVVFCPSSDICGEVGTLLKTRIDQRLLRIANHTLVREEVAAIFSDFENDSGRVLLTDRTGEEGFNLQFARCLILHDLPWSPMRIEQRLGRLDRIGRLRKILCFDVTSGEDGALCVDEAWRRVLSEGFLVFDQSISDLQHLIDVELPYLRECVFRGGPSALIARIPELAQRVAEEREQIEEQDIIDGMHRLSEDSLLCRDLARADADAEAFGQALALYLGENVGLTQRWDEDNNSFSFALPKHRSQLIPTDRLNSIAEMLYPASTVHRGVSVETPQLQFLRPGHASVDACTDLLSWDDRGRAFAMWRLMPGLESPKLVFRCIVRVRVDLRPVERALADTNWDALQRGGLLRMVRGWFPDFLVEAFLDEAGNSVSAEFVVHCRQPYDNAFDKNLGKERAALVRSTFGANTWSEWCHSVGKAALKQTRSRSEFQQQKETALAEATEHFLLLRTRINARRQAGIDSTEQTNTELSNAKNLESLVMTILSAPIVEFDTMGAYVLSAQPFWEKA